MVNGVVLGVVTTELVDLTMAEKTYTKKKEAAKGDRGVTPSSGGEKKKDITRSLILFLRPTRHRTLPP